jgi:hypothetical protein
MQMNERMCGKQTNSYKGMGMTNQSIIQEGRFSTTMVLGNLIM